MLAAFGGFFRRFGNGGEGAGEDAGYFGEYGHDRGRGDAAGGDGAPGGQGVNFGDVADKADEQTQKQTQGHGLANEAQLGAEGFRVGLDFVKAHAVQQPVHGDGVRGHAHRVQRGDGALGILIIGGPAFLDNLRAHERIELHGDHGGKGQPQIVAGQINDRAPGHVRIVVPQVAGLEDVGVAGQEQDNLQEQADAHKNHADFRGIGDNGRVLPAHVINGQLYAGVPDHLLDDRVNDGRKRPDDEHEAHEAHAGAKGGHERLFGRDLKAQSDDVQHHGHKHGWPEGIKETFYCGENCAVHKLCLLAGCYVRLKNYLPAALRWARASSINSSSPKPVIKPMALRAGTPQLS